MAKLKGKRDADSNRYAVELDGVFAGWLADVAGASACGDVETGPTGRRYSRRDKLQCRAWPGMPKSFYAWVLRSFGEPIAGSDGAITLVGSDGLQLSRMLLEDVVITSLTVPAIDDACRERAKIGLTLSPGGVRHMYRRARPIVGEAQERRAPAPATDHRIEIDGLIEECSFITRVEALTIAQEIDLDATRGLRRTAPVSATSLVVVLPEHKASGFFRWRERVPPGQASRRTATVTIGDPEVGFSVVLHDLRLLELTLLEPPADADDGREGTAEGEVLQRMRRDLRVEMAASAVGFCFLPGK